MPERTVLGERLLIIRRRRQLTQPELSQATGISSGNIARIEGGATVEILTGTLVRLCRALRVSSDYLLGLSDDPIAGWTVEDEEDAGLLVTPRV